MADEIVRILEQQREDLVIRILKKHEEIEANNAFVEHILSGMAELLLLLDKDFKIVQANNEFYLKTGRVPLTECPVCIADLFEKEAIEKIEAGFKLTHFEEFETQMQTVDSSLQVKVRGSIHTNPDNTPLYLLICSDYSEFHKLMIQLQEEQKRLIHSNRLVHLGEMASSIGHELTQPLNAILLFAHNGISALDLDEPDLSLVRQNMEYIVDRVNKASSIISTMRNFGRKVEEKLYPVRINELTAKTMQFMDTQIRSDNVQLEIHYSPKECTILALEVRLEQVLVNLFQNAILAMKGKDQPVLTVFTGIVTKTDLETGVLQNYVQIDIKDNGIGMREDVQQAIFEPFFTSWESGHGLGLGLSIVERIVQSFQGSIEVKTTYAAGTCFSLFFPQYSGVL